MRHQVTDQRVHALLSEAAECLRQQRGAKAKKLSEQAVSLAPNSADAHMVLADALASRREDDRARQHYEKATLCDKHHFGAWLNYGVFHKEKREFRNAVRCFKNAVMLDAKSTLARYNLARALFDAGDYREASVAFKVFLGMEPGFAEGYQSLGETQALAGQFDDAIESYETALKLKPDDASTYFRIGNVYQVLGRFEVAEPYHRKAIDMDPSFGKSYAALAMYHHLGDDENAEDVLKTIEEEIARDDRNPASLIYFHTAASRILDRQGRYDESFVHYRALNDMRDAAVEDLEAEEREWLDASKQLFTREFFTAKAALGNPTTQPVLIVGMPRSGTTLTEQILASHPAVFGAGELPALRKALISFASTLEGEHGYPAFMHPISDKQLRDLAQRYMAFYPEEACAYDRVTDKLPDNYAFLGAFQLMFPEAKIIYCRRNAIDTCLSCYMQNFTLGIWYSFSLEKLARRYLMHLEYMDLWREALPRPIHEIRYEELTEQPEAAVRKMLEFCDLEWDDACLNFHETERAVQTASTWQVRQPMYTTSVARWKRYEKHLGPLIEGLGDHAFT